jgi:hypothetical protein
MGISEMETIAVACTERERVHQKKNRKKGPKRRVLPIDLT